MVHQYKLIYFNARGRAEASRLVLAYAGVDYTDFRFDRSEWPTLKQQMPFGQVPVLEVDGGKVVLSQSKAIARYLGNEFNLVPKEPLKAARGDMLVDGFEDVQKHLAPLMQEQDPAKKKELLEKIEKEHLAPFLKLYEKFLIENGTKYFVTDSITWADLFMFQGFSTFKHISPHLFESHHKLNEFIDNVAKQPKISEWLEKRPKTEF